MNITALRLVAHTIKPIKDFRENLLTEKLLTEATEIARRNRVFLAFYEGLSRLSMDIPEHIHIIWRKETERKKAFKKALTEIVEVSKQNNIKFLVFKSIKPFTYVGDDIDILVPEKHNFNDFIEIIKNIGYISIGGGPPEETLVKYINGVKVMIDVHRMLSASYIPYVDALNVWRRKVKRKINGVEIYMPSLNDEMLILAGHSLLKEFKIRLADFYHGLFLMPKINFEELYEIAKMEKMSYPLEIFISILGRMYEILYEEDLPYLRPNLANDNNFAKIVHKIIENDLRKKLKMPYYYPLSLTALSYIGKLRDMIACGDKELLNFLKAPFTSKEGLNVLLKYLSIIFKQVNI